MRKQRWIPRTTAGLPARRAESAQTRSPRAFHCLCPQAVEDSSRLQTVETCLLAESGSREPGGLASLDQTQPQHLLCPVCSLKQQATLPPLVGLSL